MAKFRSVCWARSVWPRSLFVIIADWAEWAASFFVSLSIHCAVIVLFAAWYLTDIELQTHMGHNLFTNFWWYFKLNTENIFCILFPWWNCWNQIFFSFLFLLFPALLFKTLQKIKCFILLTIFPDGEEKWVCSIMRPCLMLLFPLTFIAALASPKPDWLVCYRLSQETTRLIQKDADFRNAQRKSSTPLPFIWSDTIFPEVICFVVASFWRGKWGAEAKRGADKNM